MNADAKKTVLRMIPYGIYVLTAEDDAGNVAAATVNWVTQTAFAPPLLVVGVKTDSGAYKVIRVAKSFALNMLGKEHKSLRLHLFPTGRRKRRQAERPALPQGHNRRPYPDRRARRRRMQGHRRGRTGRPPHRGRRSSRGPSQPAASRPPRHRHPGNEGPWRQRVLRRLGGEAVKGPPRWDVPSFRHRCICECQVVALLYGPAARCKPKVMIWRRLVLRFCIRPIDGAFEAPGHHGYPRAHSISFATRPRRPEGPPDHERAGETFSPSRLSNSQTSAGKRKRTLAFGISLSRQPSPLLNLSMFISGRCLHDARFIAALLCQHSPGDPRQLVGECRG